MEQRTNRQWILKTRPEGLVDPSLFELRESPVPALADGQVLAQTMYLSFDPTQRAWMSMDTYMPMVPLGEPMRASGIAQVIESRHGKFKPGDIINYLCGWQEFVVFEPDRPGLVPAYVRHPFLEFYVGLADGLADDCATHANPGDVRRHQSEEFTGQHGWRHPSRNGQLVASVCRE